MSFSVFDYTDYKKYLSARLPTRGGQRGLRAKLAHALRCQAAYVSQVLHSATHFSLEHSILIDRFLEHGREESQYFILLVHQGRAGSKDLRDYYGRQIAELRKKRELVAERIPSGDRLPKESAMTYYHRWYYSAIHVLLLISRFQKREALAERLHLPLSTVSEAVDFLLRAGLCEETSGRLRATHRRLHLAGDNIILSQHHVNWRVQALSSLDRRDERELHYAGPLALTEENMAAIKTVLLGAIEETERIVTNPGEEEAFCVVLDLFRV